MQVVTEERGTEIVKKVVMFILSLILALSGLAVGNSVETMKEWSFQYNEATNDYSLFFALCDKNDKYVSAEADVDIKIINDNGEIVYEGTKSITKKDFGNYFNQVAGDRYLANIRIDANEISEGTSSSGTVYFTVHNDDVLSFDEVNCEAYLCLPIKDIQVTVDSLPVELQQKTYDGSIESKLIITNVTYIVDDSLINPNLKFIIYGEKTYEKSEGLNYDIINYKLYDSDGYMVNSGHLYVGKTLSIGDKFKDDSLVIYDVTPGESYTLQFLNYEW